MSKPADDREHNPYAPPQSAASPREMPSMDSIERARELQLLNLLDELAKDPIWITGYAEGHVDPGKPSSLDQKSRPRWQVPTVMFATAMFVVGFAIVRFVPALGISICAAVVGALAVIAWLKPAEVRWRRSAPCNMPAGEYSWLISDGGLFIRTPANAQWAIPWSLVERIYCERGVWRCQFLQDLAPPWQMPTTALTQQDNSRLAVVVNFLSPLASARRPHPVCHTERDEWSANMSVLSGSAWTVLADGPRVWCEVRGLVCSLPSAKVQNSATTVAVSDAETSWTVDLPV